MLYIIVIVGVIILDRIVKTAVDNSMNVGDSIPVLGDFFHITYIQNSGAAFSMLQNHSTILIILPAAVILIGIIVICTGTKKYKPIFLWALALMCGGGLGNLTDRLAYGKVIDMFDFGFFPVFNVADIAVCVGCGLLVVYMIVYENSNTKV